MKFTSGPASSFLPDSEGPEPERKAHKTGLATAGPDRFAEPAEERTVSANRINGTVFCSGFTVTGHRYPDRYDPYPDGSRQRPREPARVAHASAPITVSITISTVPAGYGFLPPERTRPMDFTRKRLLNATIAFASGTDSVPVKTERSFAKHSTAAPASPFRKRPCINQARIRYGPAHFSIRCPAGMQEEPPGKAAFRCVPSVGRVPETQQCRIRYRADAGTAIPYCRRILWGSKTTGFPGHKQLVLENGNPVIPDKSNKTDTLPKKRTRKTDGPFPPLLPARTVFFGIPHNKAVPSPVRAPDAKTETGAGKRKRDFQRLGRYRKDGFLSVPETGRRTEEV